MTEKGVNYNDDELLFSALQFFLAKKELKEICL